MTVSDAVRQVMIDYAWENFQHEVLPDEKDDLLIGETEHFCDWYMAMIDLHNQIKKAA